MRRNAMPYGVLDERLQQHVRYECVICLGGEVDTHIEPVAEAHALDLEIALDEVHFIDQPYLGRCSAVDRKTQQLAESGEHAVSARGIYVDQRGDGVERVEKKMWV